MKRKKSIQDELNVFTNVVNSTLKSFIRSRSCIFAIVTIVLLLLTTPLAVFASPGANEIGSGRVVPSIAMIIGLVGIVVGRQAMIRIQRSKNGRHKAISAVVLGLMSLSIGVLHAAKSAGGFGTGNGRAGAIVAIALGTISVVLGGIALARSRRII